MAELANQLAGRMENRMLPHNVDVSVSIPVVLRGEHVFIETRAELRPLVFDAPGGLITVWIDIELLEGFSVSFDRDESKVAVAEGETLIF